MFSDEIKLKAMVACGRRCCICHKFCGNNMEVHHIRAKADGGADTFENAIPLCFDCHAEVRQYDPKHPKGIKFSEKELILHRDRWYATIKSGSPNSKNDKDDSSHLEIHRKKNYQDTILKRISNGQELLALADKACALEYSYDEPHNKRETNYIKEVVQLLNYVLDYSDIYESDERVAFAYEVSGQLKKIDKAGFWLFLAVEDSTIAEESKALAPFPILLARIVRKDNPEILKISEV